MTQARWFLAMIIGLLLTNPLNTGCIRVPHPPQEQDGLWTFVDGGIGLPDVTPPVHECLPENLFSDFYNCGVCDNVCDGLTADRCSLGLCVCGLEGRACGPTQECRFGECRQSDTNGRICEFDSTCPAGQGCVRGYCSVITCVPEVCDGADNDCDGTIDGTLTMPLSRWCYDDDTPVTTVLNPPCRRGVQVCDNGAWQECEGARSPVFEAGTLACNGEDEDCDGCVDGIMNETTGMCEARTNVKYDILFVIDSSASMAGIIDAVRTATDSFSSTYMSDPDFRFGIVLFPSVTSRILYYDIVLTLSDYITFRAVLGDIVTGTRGDEPSWDIIQSLGLGTIDVNWRRDSTRIIILFTDEPGQSFGIPPADEASMCASLAHGEVLAGVIDPLDIADFDECAVLFDLTRNPVTMAANLETIISDPCD